MVCCPNSRVQAPPAGSAVAMGERDQIFQVIQNLVENAVRYSPDGAVVRVAVDAGLDVAQAQAVQRTGAPRLALLTPDRDEAARYVRVMVADSGKGLARQHLPRLTERFYRVNAKSSREKGGTGLGLAIVKHIVNRHRGEFRIASEPGKGSTFTFVIDEQARRPSAVH